MKLSASLARKLFLLGVTIGSLSTWATDFKDFFPSDYPAIEAKGPSPYSSDNQEEAFKDDINRLTRELKDSVSYFAKRRTSTCLGVPCKIQAFPIVYTSQLSGFWGGVHANVLDVTTTNPYRAKLDGQVVRADSREWMSFATLDIPKISLYILEPRLKLRADYSLSTEFQYYGTGEAWQPNLAEVAARYELDQKDTYMTFIFPLSDNGKTRVGISATYTLENFGTGTFHGRTDTLLYADKPLDYQGSFLQSWSAGLVVDSRDSESVTRHGEQVEIALEHGWDHSHNDYLRGTIIDRRYYSAGSWTLAHRLSADAFFNTPPFWKLRSVGGTDPILDLNGSEIFVGAVRGRYHERFKIIESLEPRWHLRPVRFFGQLAETSVIPVGIDLGQFGPHFAWAGFTGLNVWWNRSLLLQLFVARNMERTSLNFLIGNEF